jgi:Ca-activated chloride channel family protein
MAPVTKLASILLVVLALGALQIAVPSLNPAQTNVDHPTQASQARIELPANTGSWQVANYQEAERGSLFFQTNQDKGLSLSPSLSTKATIKVSGVVARTQLKQTFHNNSDQWVNGLYVFPLPENAALDHLQIQIGERIIEGQIKEKHEANMLFEQAKNEGKKASLIVQQRPNLFTNSIANIGPNETIVISIEYQQTLAYEHQAFQLRLPLTITPRYTPSSPEQVADQQKADTPVSYPAPATLEEDISIEVMLQVGLTLNSITSDFHRIKSQKVAEGEYSVQLDQQSIANQDFVLRWQPQLSQLPQIVHFQQNVNGNQYGLVMIYPPLNNNEKKANLVTVKREVIFVLDTSGSMSGTSLEQAKQALLVALSDLNPADRFNVIEFNSYAQNLWSESKQADLVAITAARNFIINLVANGGTEIASALNLAFAQHSNEPERLRQIVFITDGSVGNEEALMRLITEKLQDSRLFTVGIGSAPNSYFMTEAALMGRGTYTYIGSIEQVKNQMLGLLNKLAHPALTDIQLQLNGSSVKAQSAFEFYPRMIADLYLGEPLVLSYRQNPLAIKEEANFSLLGRYADTVWNKPLSLGVKGQQSGLNVLWARQKIAQLSRDQRSAMLDNPSNEQLDKYKQDITQTALEHHLVSQYTSLVAIDLTPTKPAGLLAQNNQVANHTPKGSTASSPLAQLPATATTAELNMLIGLLLLGSALCLRVINRKTDAN